MRAVLDPESQPAIDDSEAPMECLKKGIAELITKEGNRDAAYVVHRIPYK